MDEYDFVVIGGGVTGFAAAMYAGRFEMKTAVISEKTGGTIILTDDVANYPGFKQITGIDLANRIQEHAQEYGITLLEQAATAVERTSKGEFIISLGDQRITAKTVLLATGTIWRKLNVPGEDSYTGKGVHYCALCDGAFYKDKIIAVVGGSDSAAKEALLLAGFGKKVYIIYRGSDIHPEPINLKRIHANKKIEIINHTNVVEIEGARFVNKVILDRPHNGSKELALDAVFIDIGHIPLSDLAKGVGVTLNAKGEVPIDRECKTNIPGFFAAGDVADTVFKQAITGVAEGVTAAYSAHEYIMK